MDFKVEGDMSFETALEKALQQPDKINDEIAGHHTFITFAVKLGREDLVLKIMKKYPNTLSYIILEGEYRGHTALTLAIKMGHIGIAEKIIEFKAETINHKIPWGTDRKETPYFIAYDAGKKDLIKKMIKVGYNLSKQDSLGRTLLWLAASKGDPEIVNMMLLMDDTGYEPDNQNVSPFRIACENDHLEVVNELLKSWKFGNISINSSDLEYALQCAIKFGHSDLEAELRDKGIVLKQPEIEDKAPVSKTDKSSDSGKDDSSEDSVIDPLREAIDKKQYDLITKMLNNGADVNKTDEYGRTPLWDATNQGDLKMVSILLENGASNIPDKKGITPFVIACTSGHSDILKRLLGSNGLGDLNVDCSIVDKVDNNGFTPLMYAVYQGKHKIVSILMEHGASNVPDKYGFTPLHAACDDGNLRIVEMLLKSKDIGDLNVGSSECGTPLEAAVAAGRALVVAKLIESGVDINILDKKGKPPILNAIIRGELGIAKILLNNGAKLCNNMAVDDEKKSEYEALFHAVINNDEGKVKVLLSSGLNIDCVDDFGENLLFYAERFKFTQIADYLRESGGAHLQQNYPIKVFANWLRLEVDIGYALHEMMEANNIDKDKKFTIQLPMDARLNKGKNIDSEHWELTMEELSGLEIQFPDSTSCKSYDIKVECDDVLFEKNMPYYSENFIHDMITTNKRGVCAGFAKMHSLMSTRGEGALFQDWIQRITKCGKTTESLIAVLKKDKTLRNFISEIIQITIYSHQGSTYLTVNQLLGIAKTNNLDDVELSELLWNKSNEEIASELNLEFSSKLVSSIETSKVLVKQYQHTTEIIDMIGSEDIQFLPRFADPDHDYRKRNMQQMKEILDNHADENSVIVIGGICGDFKRPGGKHANHAVSIVKTTEKEWGKPFKKSDNWERKLLDEKTVYYLYDPNAQAIPKFYSFEECFKSLRRAFFYSPDTTEIFTQVHINSPIEYVHTNKYNDLTDNEKDEITGSITKYYNCKARERKSLKVMIDKHFGINRDIVFTWKNSSFVGSEKQDVTQLSTKISLKNGKVVVWDEAFSSISYKKTFESIEDAMAEIHRIHEGESHEIDEVELEYWKLSEKTQEAMKQKMMKALDKKDWEEVKRLLYLGFDPNDLLDDSSSVLSKACEAERLDVVEILLCMKNININININEKAGGEPSPLLAAIRKKSIEIVRLLVANKTLDLNTTNFMGKSSLGVLISGEDFTGKVEMVQALLSHDTIDVNKVDKFGDTPLLMAIRKKSVEIVKLLIANKTLDVNMTNAHGGSPLAYVISSPDNPGKIEIIKTLLSHDKIEVNKVDNYGLTPLIEAIFTESIEVIEALLVHHKIDVNLETMDGFTAILIAIEEGEVEVLKLLLEHGANFDYTISEGEYAGRTLLQVAERLKDEGDISPKILELLMLEKAKKNKKEPEDLPVSDPKDDTQKPKRKSQTLIFTKPEVEESGLVEKPRRKPKKDTGVSQPERSSSLPKK